MRYRRNPTNIQTLIDFARQVGEDRLADLITTYQYDSEIAPVLIRVADKVVARLAAKSVSEVPPEEAAPTDLTDRQAWKRLEGLAGSVGASKGWPKELIDALKRVFAERAAA